MTQEKRQYPRTATCDGEKIEIAQMTASDREAVVDFVKTLSEADLLFLSRDISHPKVIDAWMRSIDEGRLVSLVARHDGVVVGCTTTFVDTLGWSRHVGELRVLVSPAWRGRGLGRLLIQECFAQALDLGLRKLIARMTLAQHRAIGVFEELGFRAEAMLSRHVADRNGALHDLVIMSHDVETVSNRQAAYGLHETLGESAGR
ncbi:MAG: GNAT family N-acetyltransferase [Burkholderiaceae bacterium]